MSKRKVFSLLLGGDVALAAGTKVLSKKKMEQLVSVQDILKKVQEDAARFKIQMMKEIEVERDQARKKGFEEGLKSWAKHLAALEEATKKAQHDLQKMVVPVAIKAARKIVGRETTLAPETTVEIVANTLKAVSQDRQITVYIHPSNLDLFEKNKATLKSVFDRLETLSIQPRDDIPPGGCVIETETGIINAEIENQWVHLQQAMESALRK